jgi:hypothetical protein
MAQQFSATDDVAEIRVVRDDDAHDVGPTLADPREKLHPGGLGYPLIGDDDLDPFLREDLLGGGGAGGGQHLEGLVERPGQGIQRQRLVVDQQDGRDDVSTCDAIYYSNEKT